MPSLGTARTPERAILVLADALALALATAWWEPVLASGAVVAGLLTFGLLGLYRRRFTMSVLGDLGRLTRGGAAIAGALIVVGVTAETLDPLTAVALLTACLVGVPTGRAVAYALVRGQRRRGATRFPAVLLGVPEDVVTLWNVITDHPETGLRVVGHIAPDTDSTVVPLPSMGTTSQLEAILVGHEITDIIISAAGLDAPAVVDALRSCEVDAEVHVLPALHELLPRRFGDDEIWGLPLVRLNRNPLRRSVRRRAKRAMDMLGATVAIALAAPIMACVAVAVRLELGPHVLFRQRRVGLDGREFDLVKFRSMRPVVEGAAGRWSAADPDRLGPVGRLIRKYSLDELPQLINVLKGDMSLVGPRPELPEYVEEFSARVPDYRHRLRAPAGLTGLSAVVGLRGDTSIHQRAYFDNRYIDDWSLWSDVRILLRTAGTVLRGTGK